MALTESDLQNMAYSYSSRKKLKDASWYALGGVVTVCTTKDCTCAGGIASSDGYCRSNDNTFSSASAAIGCPEGSENVGSSQIITSKSAETSASSSSGAAAGTAIGVIFLICIIIVVVIVVRKRQAQGKLNVFGVGAQTQAVTTTTSSNTTNAKKFVFGWGAFTSTNPASNMTQQPEGYVGAPPPVMMGYPPAPAVQSVYPPAATTASIPSHKPPPAVGLPPGWSKHGPDEAGDV